MPRKRPLRHNKLFKTAAHWAAEVKKISKMLGIIETLYVSCKMTVSWNRIVHGVWKCVLNAEEIYKEVLG